MNIFRGVRQTMVMRGHCSEAFALLLGVYGYDGWNDMRVNLLATCKRSPQYVLDLQGPITCFLKEIKNASQI